MEEKAEKEELALEQMVADLRALEWELSDLVRRVEAAKQQVRALAERLSTGSDKETT